MGIVSAIKGKLPKNNFLKNAAVLAGGTAASQLITLLISPILTRIYSPEDLGIFSVYASIVGVIVIISGLRYEWAIPIAKTDRQAANVSIVAVTALLFITALSYIVALLGAPYFQKYQSLEKIYDHLWLIPLGVVLAGSYQILNFWSFRDNTFSAVAKTRMGQTLTSAVLQLGLFKLSALGLIAGQLGGQFVGIRGLAKISITKNRLTKVKKKYVLWSVKKFKNFPLYSTWGALFNFAGMQLPLIAMAILFGPLAAGIYALTQRVLTTPIWIIGNSVANVFISKARRANERGKLRKLVFAVYTSLATVALPFCLIFAISAPDVFALIFGENWRNAGEFARWMTPWIYISFVVGPLDSVFEIKDKQQIRTIFQGVMFVLRFAALIFGAKFGDQYFAIGMYSLVTFLGYLILLYIINSLVGGKFFNLVDSFVKAWSWSVVIVIPLVLGKILKLDEVYFWGLLLLSLILCFSYLAFLYRSLKKIGIKIF